MNKSQFVQYESPESQRTPVRAGVTAFATLTAALISGTGGAYASTNINLYSSATPKPLVLVIDHERRRMSTTVFGTSDVVLRVREAFGMNFSQLARVFGVTRQTVYDWLQGAEPRQNLVAKLWKLHAAAEQMTAVPVGRKSSYLQRPILAGKNLLEILEEDGPIEEAIAALAGDAKEQNHPRWRASSSRKRRNTVEDVSRVLA